LWETGSKGLEEMVVAEIDAIGIEPQRLLGHREIGGLV
jgi:hypothetical protein